MWQVSEIDSSLGDTAAVLANGDRWLSSGSTIADADGQTALERITHGNWSTVGSIDICKI